MVHNDFIACEVCGTIINLRIQMGSYDIPIRFHCPKCETRIDGKVVIEPYKIDISDANPISTKVEECYSVELSAEFPTRKIKYKKIKEAELTPFIRNLTFYTNDKNSYEFTQESMRFADFLVEDWDVIKQNYRLLLNRQFKLLYPRLEKLSKLFDFIPIKNVKNELDAATINHQVLLTISGVVTVLGGNTLSSYMELNQKIFKADKGKIEQLIKFVVDEEINLDEIEKKMISLIDSFSTVYEQLIPVISLRNANNLEQLDKDEYGISIASFEELSDFYAKSYEWILANIGIIVALNNIVARNDYNKCINGKSLSDFNNLTKGSKLNSPCLSLDEPFSKPIASLRTILRNAIQHFDSEINYQTQIITFKNQKRSEELFLIEFANLCIDNFSIMFYLLEVVYSLRKIKLINSGIAPTISDLKKDDILPKKRSKIGRNEPCFCGSGKKYKKCCIGKG
ncbi:hypothetical protein FACS1894111_12570 [Clostridia bacterium]|nr:hypothetical protein FACS1894111_12570 [Clostridia bacterium]